MKRNSTKVLLKLMPHPTLVGCCGISKLMREAAVLTMDTTMVGVHLQVHLR